MSQASFKYLIEYNLATEADEEQENKKKTKHKQNIS